MECVYMFLFLWFLDSDSAWRLGMLDTLPPSRQADSRRQRTAAVYSWIVRYSFNHISF